MSALNLLLFRNKWYYFKMNIKYNINIGCTEIPQVFKKIMYVNKHFCEICFIYAGMLILIQKSMETEINTLRFCLCRFRLMSYSMLRDL